MMRIDTYSMNLQAVSYDKEVVQVRNKEKLMEKSANKTNKIQQASNNGFRQEIRQQLQDLRSQQNMENKVETKEITWEITEEEHQKLTLLERIISMIMGKEFRFLIPKQKIKNYPSLLGSNLVQQSFTYEEEVSYYKKSEMTFSTKGSVTTADGRTINFDLCVTGKEEMHVLKKRKVEMQQSFLDPLVLNFDGTLPALTEEKYSFDLDFDGKSDQISFLTGNSGFLALDKNEDGIINDGRELFGTVSGSGFKDLAVYDDDHNGWIDENDPIFDKLRIWTKDSKGNDQLLAIGEKGIGAIYLGSVTSQLDIMANDYTKKGRIRESGIFLNEDGTAHNIHHLDLGI